MAVVPANGNSIAFANDAHEMDQAWTNIDGFVIAVQTQRGRPSEFDHTEAGTATWTLQDRLGVFDPTNAGSPHAGEVVPMKQAKVNFEHPIAGTYHDIFTGYTSDFNYGRIGPRGAQTVLALVDGFEVLTRAEVTPGSAGTYYAAQHVDDRIRAALGDANWAAILTRIATGNVNVQAQNYDAGSPLLQVIQEGADAEFPGVANFFMDKSGYAAFSGRGIRFDPLTYPDWITRWRVGDEASCALDPTLLPIFDIKEALGVAFIYNDVLCAPRGFLNPDIASNHVTDATSITKYGRRSLSMLDLLTLDGSTSGNDGIDECRVYANYYKNNYATPQSRIDSIEFHGQMDDGTTAPGGASGNLWDFILNVEINHIIEVHTINPGGGGFAGVDFFVEGITNDISRLNDKVPRWAMNLQLSPRAHFASYP